MRKKVLLAVLLLVILAACFFPVTQQKTIPVNSQFLNTYSLLASPEKWEQWRPDLRKDVALDSGKISIKKDSAAFAIKYHGLELNVKQKGNYFDINEVAENKTTDYRYSLVPDIHSKTTWITVERNTIAIKYLLGAVWPGAAVDTHINDLKAFMETDSLRYGFRIFKTGVPESFLIVSSQAVVNKDKFTEAATLLTTLQTYVATHGVKQMQPLIAQFLPTVKDSMLVKVGLFIDKEVKSDNVITFNRMPKGGPLYAARFSGQFDKRQRVYDALKQYYADHVYQSAILPFEMYLDNKLPTSDTSRVNIQVNFSGYF